MLPRIINIRRKPQQTRQKEEYRTPPHNIIGIKPANQRSDISPEFPGHDENDGEVEEGGSRGVLGGVVAGDGDDADVEEVDEEFVGGDFLGFAGAPEEPFVEVLADYGGLVEAHCFSELSFGGPLGGVEA